MFENSNMEPQSPSENQLEREYVSSQIAKLLEEKQPRIDKLEKKLLSDIQTIEVLKYEFCDLLKFSN
jgi:hypothetical protein